MSLPLIVRVTNSAGRGATGPPSGTSRCTSFALFMARRASMSSSYMYGAMAWKPSTYTSGSARIRCHCRNSKVLLRPPSLSQSSTRDSDGPLRGDLYWRFILKGAITKWRRSAPTLSCVNAP